MKLSPKATLAKGALMTYLAPKLAQDAKIELSPLLDGVTKANFGVRKPHLIAALKGAVQGKLVQGATLDDVGFLMDAVEKAEGEEDVPEGEDEETEEEKARREARRAEDRQRGMDCAADEDPETEEEREHRKEMRASAAKRAQDARRRRGHDESEGEREEREGAEDRKAWDTRRGHDAASEVGVKSPVTKEAMDAALATAVKNAEAATVKRMNGIADAKSTVEPLVGKIAVAMDSAEAVYSAALKQTGIPTAGINLAGMKALVEREIAHRAGANRAIPRLAHDAATHGERQTAEKALGIATKRARHV